MPCSFFCPNFSARLMFGHGLDQDVSRPTGYDTVSLLDEKTCSDLLADYATAQE
jgi:hypothetical protein